MLCHLQCLEEIIALNHQQTNQLGNGNDRVRVVELYRKHLREIVKRAVLCLMLFQRIGKRSRTEEILLFEAQCLALAGVIIGIQTAREILCSNGLGSRLQIMLVVEGVEIKCIDRLSLPQAQGTDMRLTALLRIPENGHIIGYGTHRLIGIAYLYGFIIAALAPAIAEACPVIGGFHLSAVCKGLLEQSVAVADTVPVERQRTGCRTVKETGSQSAQTAVTECRILGILKHGE